MGKDIKVSIVSKEILRLEEDAKAGDYIDLKDIENVDTSIILQKINDETDKVYNKKLLEFKAQLEIEKQKELELAVKNTELQFNNKISSLEKLIEENKNDSLIKLKDEQNRLNNIISDLKSQINSFEMTKTLAIKEAVEKEKEEINKLLNEINNIKSENEIALIKQEKELNDKKIEEVNNLKEAYEDKLSKRDDEYKTLQHEYDVLKDTKIRMSNKVVGEDLEQYCNDAMRNLMQIGFDNCTWEKDNTSIKEEDESKGTKADFIFKIYLDETKTKELASVCLEMKNEKLDSTKKKKNSDHYDKLDKDRNKKNCKYALLVSNLELDNDNILPIYKVNEYPDMYVVRPAYFTTFLTIITSLTMKFKDIIVADINATLDLATKQEFINEFASLKNTYLDKPLASLQSKVSDIKKQSASIQDAANKINNLCDDIIAKYVGDILDKLDKYEKGIVKSYKKLEKTSNK